MLKKINEEVPEKYLKELKPVMDKLEKANLELDNINTSFKKEFGFSLDETAAQLNILEQELRKLYGTDKTQTLDQLKSAQSGRDKIKKTFNIGDTRKTGEKTFANVALGVNKLLLRVQKYGEHQLQKPSEYAPNNLNQFRGWKRTKDKFDLVLEKAKTGSRR